MKGADKGGREVAWKTQASERYGRRKCRYRRFVLSQSASVRGANGIASAVLLEIHVGIVQVVRQRTKPLNTK